jgi:uronate dehydrogenase
MTVLLLTGASGRMAGAMRPALTASADEVRLYSRSTVEPLAEGEALAQGALEDLDTLERACVGVDTVIHLGGKADEAPFDEILSSNIVGTYNVFEAARRAGVRRVVYASSHHVTGFHSVDEMVSASSDVRPDTYYGVSKVFGEALGRLYADKWGLEVVCLRIGVCREAPENADQLRTWLSQDDGVRLVLAAVESELSTGYVTVYGVSDNSRRFWDIEGAAAIGYQPQDSADAFADALGSETPFSSAFQGGRFTGRDYSGGTW